MTISLNQKQMNFLKADKPNTGFVAGLGSGKSFVSTLKTIQKKMQFKNCTVAYYLPTYGLIRDIAFDKFPTMLSEMGYKYTLNKSDKEIHIDGYGKIIFRSMDNPSNIVGYETFYTLIDECDILNQDKMTTAYEKILGRNRQIIQVEDEDILNNWHIPMIPPAGTEWHEDLKFLYWVNQMDIVGTPEGFKFFYKRYVKEFNSKTDILVKASTYDNKHLPPSYIKGLEQQYPPNLLKAYLNGEFVNLNSANVYSYFDREIHHKSVELNEYEAIHCGQDFNVFGCITTVFIIRNNISYQIDEISSNDTYGIVNNINQRYAGRVINIYPDASGNANKTNATKTDISILRDAGFNVYAKSKNPRVQDRVNSVQGLLSHNKIFIDTHKCPKTTEALEQLAYDDNGEPEKYSGGGTIDDYTDSFGYFVHYNFPLTGRNVSTYQGNFL